MLSGKPLTRMEALVLFGLSNLPELVYEMRQQGFVVKNRKVPYATAMVRINQHAVLKPPANLPIREILFTEYWVNK
ncbi:helix-turn-helix domain-containing protein [Rhizobium sp. LEGMi198b]